MNLIIINMGNRDLQLEDSLITLAQKVSDNGRYGSWMLGDAHIQVLISSQESTSLLASPREDGARLLENYDLAKKSIRFPIQEPVIKRILDYNPGMYKVILVVTDQQIEYYRNKDTIYFGEVLKKWMMERYSENIVDIDLFAIRENVTNIDSLYKQMYGEVRRWMSGVEDIDKVFLSDQAGIDAINQALRFQLLQAFTSRVHIYAKPEGGDAEELAFPGLFLHDLVRQNIKKHVNDYDFAKVDNTLQPESWMVQLCKYAAMRLELNYNRLQPPQLPRGLNLPIEITQHNWVNPRIMNKLQLNSIKLRDLYISAKISLLQNKIQEFIWKLFTIQENMFKEPVDNHINNLFQHESGIDTHQYYKEGCTSIDNNPEWEDMLNRIDDRLVQHLSQTKVKGQPLDFAVPNRFLYKEIYYYLVHEGILEPRVEMEQLTKFFEDILGPLSGIRNRIAHRMGAAVKEDLPKHIRNLNAPYLVMLDKWFDIKGMGDYDLYRSAILDHYQYNVEQVAYNK